MAQKINPKLWDGVFEHEAKKVLPRIIDAFELLCELLVTPISEESFRMKIQSYADSHWKINLVPQHFLDIKYLLDQGYGVMDLWIQGKGKVIEWTSYSHQLVGMKQALQVEQDTSQALRQQLDAKEKTLQALRQQLDAEQQTLQALRQQLDVEQKTSLQLRLLYTEMHEFSPNTTASQYTMYPPENLIARNPVLSPFPPF
ncbi:unnamed protein product [Alternaria alternata]